MRSYKKSWSSRFLLGMRAALFLLVVGFFVPLGGVERASAASLLMATDGVSSHNNSKASALGHSVTTNTLANIVASSVPYLSNFDVIWINPGIGSSGYNTLRTGVANGGALEQYVAGGGTLVINIAGNQGSQNDIAPGGVDYDRSSTHNSETFTSPSHAYLTGSGFGGHSPQLSDFINWGSTDHGQLYNLVGGTTTVLSNTHGPSFVEYVWGSGTVLLNTLTYGWGSAGAKGDPQDNLINYAGAPGPGGGKMYWVDSGTDKVQRANLDGSNIEDLVTTGLSLPRGIAVDPSGGKMYWTDIGSNKIRRANLNGSNVEDLVTTGLVDPWGIALDPAGGKMYWTDYGTNKIQRANLNGSNVEDLVTTGLSDPFGIALDPAGGKMYWTDGGANKIQRANLDGSNVQDLVTGLSRPYYIAVDPSAGKMYWTDFDTGKIQRANLDGSNIEDLVTGLSSPLGIALDPAGGKMYWTDWTANKIQRANLDGSNIENLVTTGLGDPAGIAIPQFVNLDDLNVNPQAGFNSSGPAGGPFTPGCKTYTLTNNGPNTLDWTAGATQLWLDVTPASGTLAGGASITVDVCINANANTLPLGSYNDTVTFANLTSGFDQVRSVDLFVKTTEIIIDASDRGWWNNNGDHSASNKNTYTGRATYVYRSFFVFDLSSVSETHFLDAKLRLEIENYYGSEPFEPLTVSDVTTPIEILTASGSGNVAVYDDLGSGNSYADFTVIPSDVGSVLEITLNSPAINDIIAATGGFFAVGVKVNGIGSSQEGVRFSSGSETRVHQLVLTPGIADTLSIEPTGGLISSGDEGGRPEPFTPSSKDYTLTNVGSTALNWTATVTQSWLKVTPGSGALNPGDSNTVEVSLNADVNTLLPGDYNDTITFTNTTSGRSQIRDVTLTVNNVPGEIYVTDSIPPVNDLNMPFGELIVGLSRTEQITITNTDADHELVVTEISLGGGYFEDFNDGLAQDWQPLVPNNWDVVSGEYRAQAGATYVPMESLYMGQVWQDCSAQVTMRRTEHMGSAGVLVVRASDDFNWDTMTGSAYLISISGNGNYYVGKFVSGSFSFIQSWTFSPYLNPNTASNIVMVSIEGSAIDVYFNGTLAWSGADNSISGAGRIGLLGYSGFGPETIHYFDDVLVTEPITSSQIVSAKQQWYNEHAYEGGVPEAAPDGWAPPEYPGVSEASQQVWSTQPSKGFRLENAPNLPLMLLPGQSSTFDVVFCPAEVENYSEVLVIENDDRDEPNVVVHLSGIGIPEYLDIMPVNDVEFSGHPGGPFVPTYVDYNLTNNGPVNISWTAEPNVPWLVVSPSSGTLDPCESTTVTVAPNIQAKDMNEGDYYGDVNFTDVTTTLLQKRRVILDVYTEPKIWAQPLSFDVNIAQGEIESQILTIGNTGGSALEFSLSGYQTGFTLPGEAQGISSSAPPGHDFTVAGAAPYKPEELLVRFAPKTNGKQRNKQEKEQILGSLGGGAIKRNFKIVPGLSLVKLPEGHKVKDALKTFNKKKGVLFAEPNYEVEAMSTFPNDPRFNELWGLHNTGQSGGTPDADIDAPEAWDIATDASRIIVAVIDTGVDYTHPDLAANMWVNEAELNGTPGVDDDGNGYIDDIYGYDFRNNDGDPWDDHYHGTHVAGTIGAVGNNGEGVVGVCWNVKIMALKFLSSGGSGWTADAIDCVEYSVLMGANLSSNSWGGGGYSQALKDAIDAAGAAGKLFVAAAGNSCSNNDIIPHYPSNYDSNNIIAVMATDETDNPSVWGGACTNYGATSVDLAAPGSNILSCLPGGRYGYLGGTSMATPHVGGACALVWSVCPSLSYQQVKDIILQTVDPIPALSGLCVSEGRLNVYEAVLEAQLLCGVPSLWLEFVPSSGIVAAGDAIDVNVIFDADCNAGTYQGWINISSNDPYEGNLPIPVTMTVEPIDYFTELFDPNYLDPNDPNYNDMANRTLTFRPGTRGSYYKACVSEANDFPVDPNGGTIVSLGDDDYIAVNLQDASVNFYGESYETFYIGSNGYITFISGDIRHAESLVDHFDLPRISALFDDLDPSAGGTISWKQLDDRVVVTFENVPEHSLSNSNSFQIEMRFNGKIRITLLEIDADDGLVGLSKGNGVPVYFTESDLSEYGLCNFVGDLNGDIDVDLADFAIFTACWQNQNTDMETVRDEFNSVSYSGNDGTQNWSNSWQEAGEADGPSSGLLQVLPDGSMRIGDKNAKGPLTRSLTREADLSGATTATLTYDYVAENRGGDGYVSVQVSSDGGSNWDTLAVYLYDDVSGSESFDITSYISSDTQIRFAIGSEGKIKMYVYVDNIQIEYNDSERPWYPWCNGSDFSRDFRVNFEDLWIFCEHWLE